MISLVDDKYKIDKLVLEAVNDKIKRKVIRLMTVLNKPFNYEQRISSVIIKIK